MIVAAPRKNANGDAAIRVCRTGTSSGTRERFCDSTRLSGSRSAFGSNAEWLERGARARAFRPRAARSAAVRRAAGAKGSAGCVSVLVPVQACHTSSGVGGFPSWYAVAGADRVIDPDLQRFMAQRAGPTTIQFDDASHAGGYTHYATRFVKLIEQAAQATTG